jgi:hypothetical protein
MESGLFRWKPGFQVIAARGDSWLLHALSRHASLWRLMPSWPLAAPGGRDRAGVAPLGLDELEVFGEPGRVAHRLR